MPMTNHFATLGLKPGADENAVKKAYRTLAKQWHPDKNNAACAKEKFQEIAAAYEYLSSKDRREMLERDLTRTPPTRAPQSENIYKSTPSSQNSAPPRNSANSKSTDEKKSKPKKKNQGSWSETFTKNYRSHSKSDGKNFHSPETDDPYFTFSHNGTYSRRHAPDSYADDLFEELFSEYFTSMGFGDSPSDFSSQTPSQPTRRKSRKRHVASESRKVDGLDDEYLFTPRTNPEDDGEKIPCPWCDKLFTRGKLAQHEEKCGKFGLSADESEDEDDMVQSDSDDDLELTPSYQFGYSPLGKRPSWQQQHEDLLHRLKKDKRRYQDRMASQGSRNSGYVKCPYCERSFSEQTSIKHIPWCKEHLERYGQPLNPKSPSPDTPRSGAYSEKGKARLRAREYAKSVPKPRQNHFPGTNFDDSYDDDDDLLGNSPMDGNQKRFPYTRPTMPQEDFGIWGSRFGAPDHEEDLFSNVSMGSRSSRAGSGQSSASSMMYQSRPFAARNMGGGSYSRTHTGAKGGRKGRWQY